MSKATNIAAAQNELTAAKNKVTELESAVLAGDTSVTASALSKARSDVEFASLKLVAAQQSVDQEAIDAHNAAVTTLRADYEAHVEDLDELREAYQWALIAIAELRQAIDKRRDASRALVSRGYALGLIGRSDTTGGPFPEDRARWSRNNIGDEFVGKAVDEATRGYLRDPFANRAIIHVLHTNERRAQLETITGDSLDAKAKALLAQYVAAHQD